MIHSLHQTIIRFPEIKLETRDAHKLRGYFGTLFQEHSPLLHNHLERGEIAYRYPLVQYKVLEGVPVLIGLNEGADLLISLFLKIKELKIGERSYAVLQKNIESKIVTIGLSDDLQAYRFKTLWMALSQQNHASYLNMIKLPDLDTILPSQQNHGSYLNDVVAQQTKLLKAILTGNILSFFKSMNYRAEANIMVNLKITSEKETQFKNNAMLAFDGVFVTNVLLPEFIGLGKSVSRGFGTIALEI